MKTFFEQERKNERKAGKRTRTRTRHTETTMENDRLFELCKQGDLEGLKAIIDNNPSIDVK